MAGVKRSAIKEEIGIDSKYITQVAINMRQLLRQSIVDLLYNDELYLMKDGFFCRNKKYHFGAGRNGIFYFVNMRLISMTAT